MKLFEGVSRTDYQDVLRALGRFIDMNNYLDIRIIEAEEGLIFQGRPRGGRVKPGPHFETFLITDADLQNLLHEAYDQRGKGALGPKRLGE
jgi:hypothetical protein